MRAIYCVRCKQSKSSRYFSHKNKKKEQANCIKCTRAYYKSKGLSFNDWLAKQREKQAKSKIDKDKLSNEGKTKQR